MSFISQSLQLSFREFCSGLYLKQIDAIFQTAGVPLGNIPSNTPPINGERRMRVAEYYASIDWTNFQDCLKFLDVIGLVLAQSYLGSSEKERLRDLCIQEGLVIEGNRVYLSAKGVDGKLKNLIFAANGPKPQIVLIDATNNDIAITKNAEFCLVYDRPFSQNGLSWDDLIDWWCQQSQSNFGERIDYERELYKRLQSSLASPPEELLFKIYFSEFRSVLGGKLPALIPQVYLHYDPYTISFLAGQKNLYRQRMDFLILFSHRDRVVIEVDGEQHYSERGKPSPRLYSDMMSEDRRLKLSGYEVYRFGGYELSAHEAGECRKGRV